MSGILTDHTTEMWNQRETSLARTVGKMAISSKSIEVNNADQLVVRAIQPHLDLNSGSDNNWNDDSESGTTREWQQQWSSGSGTADEYSEAYVIDTSSNAEDKVIGFFGVSFLHASVVERQLKFGIGTSGSQGIKREMNVESVENDEENQALFLTDIIYGANEDGNVEVDIQSADDGQRMVLHGFVAEPVGDTVSVATNPLRDSAGGAPGGAGRARP